jgi:hypothetical protein
MPKLDPRKLQALVSPAQIHRPPDGGKPDLAGVLYARPNPDQSRKCCANCFMWVTDESCVIHERGINIPGDAVCGYHVFGEPRDPVQVEDQGIKPVSPGLSGLIRVPGGTSCDICLFYEPVDLEAGRCYAVNAPDGTPARVEAKGCCARWFSATALPRPLDVPMEAPLPATGMAGPSVFGGSSPPREGY